MIFHWVRQNGGIVVAEASGHSSEVVTAFHSISSLLLSGYGPWRIHSVIGGFPDDHVMLKDSDMYWKLESRIKQ